MGPGRPSCRASRIRLRSFWRRCLARRCHKGDRPFEMAQSVRVHLGLPLQPSVARPDPKPFFFDIYIYIYGVSDTVAESIGVALEAPIILSNCLEEAPGGWKNEDVVASGWGDGGATRTTHGPEICFWSMGP